MLKFFASIGVATVSGLVLLVAGVGLFFATLPDLTQIKECMTTSMYSVRLCPTEAGYTKLRNISPHLRNAVLVSEDSAFYDHKGIDWFEMRESFIRNWETKQYARGGSTITQQLVKNVFLSAEKSLLRKAREIILAVRLEEILSKDEIFEKYLNVVEFGENIYGINKATRHYFGKSPSELSPAEGAFLAFLLPSPKKYSASFKKKQLTPFARSQLKTIVSRMHRFKRISFEEEQRALAHIDHFFSSAPPMAEEDPVDVAGELEAWGRSGSIVDQQVPNESRSESLDTQEAPVESHQEYLKNEEGIEIPSDESSPPSEDDFT